MKNSSTRTGMAILLACCLFVTVYYVWNQNTKKDIVTATHTEKNTPQLKPPAPSTPEKPEEKIIDEPKIVTITQTKKSIIPPIEDFTLHYGVNSVPKQYFQVENTSDTVLTGDGGVKVYIPANCFETENVKIEMQEFLDYPDIIKAGLTTSSNGEMLESAGMVFINAFNNNHNELKIKEGHAVKICIPGSEQEGMQLFYGSQKDGSMNWVPVNTSSVTGQVQPSEPNTLKDVPADYSYYSLDQSSLDVTEIITLQNSSIKGSKKIFDSTLVARVSRFGSLTSFIGQYDLAFSYLINQKGKPESIRMKVLAQGTDKVKVMKLSRKVARVYNTMKSLLRTMPPMEASEFRQGFRIGYKTQLITRGYTNNTQKYRCELPHDTVTQAFLTQSSQMYNSMMSVSSLGWINCDRFYKPKDNATLIVDAGTEGKIDVTVIFRKMKSVLNMYPTGVGFYQASNIPANEKVIVVAIKYIDSKMFYAIRETETGNTNVASMNFRPYDKEEWKDYFADL